MAAKLTTKQLELQAKQLELQERRALLKEAKERLEFDREYIKIQKAQELRNGLSTCFILNEKDGITTAKEYGFSGEQFNFLIKKYYNILKEL